MSLAALGAIPLSFCLPHPSPGCLPNKGCSGLCIPVRVELMVLEVLKVLRRLKDPSIWVAIPVGEG